MPEFFCILKSKYVYKEIYMKVHKVSIWCTLVICIISFTLAYELEKTVHRYEFWYSILLGIFASSILVLFSSIIGYFTSKKDTLHKFENEAYELIKQFLKISNSEDPYIQMDSLQEIARYNIVNFKNTYSDVVFFLNFIKSQKRANVDELYQRIFEMKEDISKANDELTKRIVSADGDFENEIKSFMETYKQKEKSLKEFFEKKFYGGREDE